jgi:non-specific serine/threonine protein kinase
LDWSFNLLTEDEKALLCRLSVFSGGWTVEAAEQVCASKSDISFDDVLDLLIHLVDKSLVVMSGSRYHMLETTRQYAQEKLFDSNESERVQNHHLVFFMKLAEEAEAKLTGPEQGEWLDQLEIEQNNLRAALLWGLERNAEAGLRLVSALWLFWFMRAHFIEGTQWYDKALTVSMIASPRLGMRLLVAAASNAMGLNDLERMALLSEQSLILAREQENMWGITMSLHHLGIAAAAQGDYERAQTFLEEGLVLARERADWVMTSIILDDLGRLAKAQGDYEMAWKCGQDALSLTQKHGDRWGSSYHFQFLAFIAYDQKEYHKSKALFEEAIPLAYEFQDRRHVFYLLIGIAMVAVSQGQPERAAQLMSASKVLADSIGMDFPTDEQDVMETLREQLSDAQLDALAADGSSMTLEQAVEFALDKSHE